MGKIPYFKRLSFKLTALFTLIILIGSLISGTFAAYLAKQEFNDLVKEQFHSTIAITENLIAMVGQMALNWGNHFETDYELIKKVKQKNEVKLTNYVIDFVQESRADIVIILDNNGKIILHSVQQNRKNENLSSWRIVSQSKNNQQTGTSIVQDLNNLIIFSSVVLQDGKEHIGTILIGYEINDKLISNIKTNTNIDITIVRRRAVMASTFHRSDEERLDNISIPYIQYQSQLNNPQSLGYMKLNNIEYFISAKKLQLMEPSMEGSILLSYPKAKLDEIWKKLAFNFISLFIIAIIMIAFISERFANKLLEPLRELQKYTNDIILGKSDDTLNITSNDEVGIVSENVNQLVTSINIKNLELDAYSNSLEDMVEERTQQVHVAHKSLEKKEAMLSKAQILAHMGSWTWSLKDNKVTCSDGIYNIFNIKKDQLNGEIENFLTFFSDEDHRHIAELTYLESVEKVSTFDARIKPDKSDDYLNVHVELEVEVDDAGIPVRVLGSLLDVTEQKEYEAVLQDIAEGVSTVAGEEIFNTLSKYIANVLKVDYVLIGMVQAPMFDRVKTVSFFAGQKHIDNVEYELKDTPCYDVLNGVSYSHQNNIQQKYPQDHILRELHAEAYAGIPIVDSKGEAIGLVVILNKTPLVNTDKIISLLKIFSVRITAELERQENETRLLHAKKMEAIGQLTGGVAHNFNNILASILGYTELIKGSEIIKHDEKLQEFLGQIYSSGIRARDLVQQMLDYSQSNKMFTSEIMPSLIIHQMVEMLRETTPQEIEIKTDIDDENLKILSDPAQLQQAIVNLVINARDAIKDTGKITISLKRVGNVKEKCESCKEEFTGDMIKISVHDSGKGIDPEVLQRIFDPYYTTSNLGESTGMGLSMVHGIVHSNDGHIAITSSPDNGTTINLFYPISLIGVTEEVNNVGDASLSNI